MMPFQLLTYFLSQNTPPEGHRAPPLPQIKHGRRITLGRKAMVTMDRPVLEKGGTFSIKCRLVPSEPVDGQASARVSVNGIPWDTVNIYLTDSHNLKDGQFLKKGLVKSLKLVMTGEIRRKANHVPPTYHVGSVYSETGIKLQAGSTLYELDFGWQPSGHFEQSIERAAEGGLLMSPPGLKNGCAIWPYAGYYLLSENLNTVEQLYFSISHRQQRTFIEVVGAYHLQKAGIQFGSGGVFNDRQFVFMDQTCPPRSLLEQIRMGAIQITMTLPKEGGAPALLKSIAHEVINDEYIWISFIPTSQDI